MDELKPCPFCGGQAYVQYNFYETAEVVCSNCGSKGTACCGLNGDERAIEAWNRRVPQTEVHQYGENCTHISNCGTLNLNL